MNQMLFTVAKLACRQRLLLVTCLLGNAVGCGGQAATPGPAPPPGGVSAYPAYTVNHQQIKFLDEAASNTQTAEGLTDLQFVDAAGQPVALKDHLSKKHLVLVVTRGVTTPVCVFCTTQTARLVAAYDEFSKRDAEVLVVYPVDQESNQKRFQEFLASTREKLAAPVDKIPFPIGLDLKLAAVDRLGIRQDLARPATYILDKQGEVRFAYVGKNAADRPSVKAVLAQLDEIQKGER